jgi:Mce-associated membrane protein
VTVPPSQSTPSWYDVLGVAPDASADEVRAAWRAAIADLDPTDQRFASRNRAAEVLLDPDRRAAYDAERAARAPADVDGREAEPAEPAAAEEEPAEPVAAEEEPAEPVAAEPGGAARPRTVVPAWLLAGLAVATLVVAGVALWLWV